MTNETNEQKCKCKYPNSNGNRDDSENLYCAFCHAIIELPPQEIEAKWTYSKTHNGWRDVWGLDNKLFPSITVHIDEEKDALLLCAKLNELDRLRSSMGKVPSEERITEKMLSREYDELEVDDAWINGAKWMRSEVAPVIAGLEMRNRLMIEAEKGAVGKIDSLRSELKQAKETIVKLTHIGKQLHDIAEMHGAYSVHRTMLQESLELLTPKK